MLNLKNVTVNAENKTILKDITASFEKGKVYAIMGPNGSGKSTFANIILGHPNYEVIDDSQISFLDESILDMDTHKRAQKGIFLSFQTPLELSGVTVFELLQQALSGTKDVITIKDEVKEYAKELSISEDLLNRSLNQSASGGERKKMELLQAAVLPTKLLIFDEIDTGVDVDSLKTISNFINTLKKDRTIILITHYNRILQYVRPDRVIAMVDGRIASVGGPDLAEKIEKEGYDAIK